MLTMLFGNNTLGNDTSGTDTSGNDTSGTDASGNDTSGNDTSGNVVIDLAGSVHFNRTIGSVNSKTVIDMKNKIQFKFYSW